MHPLPKPAPPERRITRHLYGMESAEIAAKRATCYRLSVGCVIMLKGRIVVSSYNGPPAGQPHCTGNQCPKRFNGGCSRSIHAEMNAIDFLKETWGTTSFQKTSRDLTMYVTTCPCADCARQIVLHTGISRVVYKHEYRNMDESLKLFSAARTQLWRITAAGVIIDAITGEIIENE